ncbi:hypothetical protein C4D60_Mb04t03080 [Musa balbisiana]|uniref:Uncharacterized protein n=1 Tax=Musa balbisiana TaxID=52838 RepID=A0A4S8K9A4_MUSBA|nr:hypothetical protein C4D60_Mb04t03080 [Musa balbisiana]
MEATTNSSTEPLLPSRASYARSLSLVDDKLRSSDPTSSVVVSTASHFVLSCTPTRRAYNMVVQLSVTSASGLSFVCRYGLRRFLFLNKIDLNSFLNLKYTCHYINGLL